MTYYFYDLETSSGSPRNGRIMQFAGQRTDENMQPIGEPDNILVKLTDDFLPEPDAVLVHGITPQKANEEGVSEHEIAKYFQTKIATKDTIFIGYNNVRFDDEFMRYLFYRNFYDPYEWHWKDNRSRWDLLDPIRMMRALRPEGMKWPMLNNKQTVKLELMAKENNLTHDNAHDALSDVVALIELAKKFKNVQPKLFSYLLSIRGKHAISDIVKAHQCFVYTSGRFDSEFEKTTVIKVLFGHPRRDAAIVYDLRYDPTEWISMDAKKLVEHWSVRWGDEKKPLPVKTMQYNHCPAVAPLSVIDESSRKRISYDQELFSKHQKMIESSNQFLKNMKKALDILENQQQSRLPLNDDVDTQLYDGFWSKRDRADLDLIRQTDPNSLTTLTSEITNKRLRRMIPLYKARNYYKLLTNEEREFWEDHRRKVFLSGGEKSTIAQFTRRMQTIFKDRKLSENDKFLLSELQLYVESIIPEQL